MKVAHPAEDRWVLVPGGHRGRHGVPLALCLLACTHTEEFFLFHLVWQIRHLRGVKKLPWAGRESNFGYRVISLRGDGERGTDKTHSQEEAQVREPRRVQSLNTGVPHMGAEREKVEGRHVHLASPCRTVLCPHEIKG